MKDHVVANSRLSRAASEFDLDKFIITKGLKLQSWRPIYISDYEEGKPASSGARNMSSKTLADVVEALIGASYLDGGLSKATDCIQLFLPDEEWRWQTLDEVRHSLYWIAPSEAALPATMEVLESLIGYTFRKKSLLVEAMTHGSYHVPGTLACFERLEFYGDALLDYLVVRQLYRLKKSDGSPFPHQDMHLFRTALVNCDFMGFLVMEWAVATIDVDHIDNDTGDVPPTTAAALWAFMLHSSADLGLVQREMTRRHQEQRVAIREAIDHGTHYPWAQLARLRIYKFYSDLLESVLAAVWVDSGSFDECDRVLERVGLLPYLRRLVHDQVHVMHPKEELGRLAGSEKVIYDIIEPSDGLAPLSCRVSVGSQVVVKVTDGVSRAEVRTRAAQEAIKYYYSLGGRWPEEESN
jgi:dsRNA-specific ribonuclease